MVEKRAFEKVFRRHYDGMYRVALRMLDDEAESKDVVSEVFAHLLDSGKDLRSETLGAYLLTSVRNRCINVLVHRQKAREQQRAMVVEMVSAEQTAEEEQLQLLHHVIETRMPKLSQQILRLRYQQGLKYREIADVMQVSEVTVHNHLSQSLKLLKDHLKTLGYGVK